MTDQIEVLHVYTRAQAVADGEQILLQGELAQMAKDQGIVVPIYFTRLAWADAVKWEKGADSYGQDEKGRLHDVLFVLGMTIRANRGGNRVKFSVSVVQEDGRKLTTPLYAEIGATDHNNPAPAITIMVGDDL